MLALADVTVVRGGTSVLTGVDAVFAPGRCTAVAGPSGAGKSTLLRLLDRLLEPSSGAVLFHGRPLPSYDVLELRRRIGLVQQAPVLLADTVLADLAVGRPTLSDDEAARLLERAGLPVPPRVLALVIDVEVVVRVLHDRDALARDAKNGNEALDERCLARARKAAQADDVHDRQFMTRLGCTERAARRR